ncbi:MAG: InlB B-repeat-containing protein [Treponema sp.]|nr:InlB B-repeat-containing protein [Treponema sp.]
MKKKSKGALSLVAGIMLAAVLAAGFTACDDGNANVTFTVIFDANNGSGTPPAQMQANANSAITLPDQSDLARSDFIFDGWNTSSAGTGANYPAGSSYILTGNTTLYAKWNTAAYTVTFDANDGDGKPPNPAPASAGSGIILPGQDSLIKSGHTFGGWNTEADGTGTNYSAGSFYSVNGNITLYARWDITSSYSVIGSITVGGSMYEGTISANQTHFIRVSFDAGSTYRIYWNDNDNTDSLNADVRVGLIKESNSSTVQPVVDNTGNNAFIYTVSPGEGGNYLMAVQGFYSGGRYDAGVICIAGTVTVNGDIYQGSLIADQTQYVLVSLDAGSAYKISWNDRDNQSGSSFTDIHAGLIRESTSAVVHSFVDNRSTNAFIYAVPSGADDDDNYLIAVQGLSSSFSGRYEISCESTSDSITACSVVFNANSGSGTPPVSMSASEGSDITLPGQGNLAKSGNFFIGWNTEADGTGTNYPAGSTYTVTGEIILYAEWDTAAPCAVTFNLNGGTGSAPGQIARGAGLSATLPGQGNLAKSGYIFNGWNTEADGTGTNYSAGYSYTVTGNITLYARWETAYTVTFDANGGTGAPSERAVMLDSIISLPGEGNLTRSGFVFNGWNTEANGSGTNYPAGYSYTVTENVTLYARWGNIATPTGLKAEAISSSGISLSWNAVQGASGYYVYINTSSSAAGRTKSDSLSSTNNITLSNLSANTTYYFWVTAYNNSAESSLSSYVYTKTYPVTSTMEVTIAMWDSYGDGWNNNAALRISVDRTNLATNARITSGGTGSYTFNARVGEVVELYWVSGGQYDYECAFAVYYTDNAPNPSFNPSSGTSDTSKLLASKLYSPSGVVGNGTLMGSFTVGTIMKEDFEGTTHSFTIVNGTQTNKWWVGTATAESGAKSAYISNNSGASNAYTITTASTVHMYRDVTFTAAPVSTYTLSFDWKAQGETTSSTLYDYLTVYLVDTSTSITAGSLLNATALGTFNLGGSSDWNQATIDIPASNNGTTKRLVFTWRNDNSQGSQPPVAIDNILLTR